MPKLIPGANYFWKKHHPALGIRIPEIFLKGIVAALKTHRVAAGLELSFGRETSLEEVIQAPPGKYPISLGHTGTSIPHYLKAAESAAQEAEIPIELEADHLIVIGSADLAVKRIEGVWELQPIDEKKLEENFQYNFAAIEQAIASAPIRAFTTDTSDLIWRQADQLSGQELKNEFEETLAERGRKRLLERYSGKRFKITAVDGAGFEIEFSHQEIFRLFLKYRASIRANAKLYDYLWKKVICSKAFGFEISMDETEFLTPLPDAFFYLNEWAHSGRHFDYFAPNIGFKKRADYQGSLSELGKRAKEQAALVNYFDGALICFHSGSGATPWSGKGKGVYPALLKATGSRLKYKISGVYYELLLELLNQGEAGAKGKKLYNQIFDRVYKFCQDQVKKNKELASDLLKKQLAKYDEDLKRGRCKARDPRADFFRFNSWLALALRDQNGNRIYRNQLVELYQANNRFQKKMDQEIFELTERLIQGLQFGRNY